MLREFSQKIIDAIWGALLDLVDLLRDFVFWVVETLAAFILDLITPVLDALSDAVVGALDSWMPGAVGALQVYLPMVNAWFPLNIGGVLLGTYVTVRLLVLSFRHVKHMIPTMG